MVHREKWKPSNNSPNLTFLIWALLPLTEPMHSHMFWINSPDTNQGLFFNGYFLFLYNFERLLSIYSYYKILAILPMLYNLPSSLSYTPYFIPSNSSPQLPPPPALVTTSLFYLWVLLYSCIFPLSWPWTFFSLTLSCNHLNQAKFFQTFRGKKMTTSLSNFHAVITLLTL